jgi:hypothetical protein
MVLHYPAYTISYVVRGDNTKSAKQGRGRTGQAILMRSYKRHRVLKTSTRGYKPGPLKYV